MRACIALFRQSAGMIFGRQDSKAQRAFVQGNLARALLRETADQDLQQAMDFAEQVSRDLQEELGPEHPEVGWAKAIAGRACLQLQRPNDAAEHLWVAVRLLEGGYGPNHDEVTRAIIDLAKAHLDTSRSDTALTLLTHAARLGKQGTKVHQEVLGERDRARRQLKLEMNSASAGDSCLTEGGLAAAV